MYEDFGERSALERGALRATTLLRKATMNFPPALLHGLCMAGTPLVLLSCTLPHQILKRLPPTRQLAERIPYRHTSNPTALVSDLYDRFAPPIEERYNRTQVLEWFQAEGLKDVEVINHRGWVAWGRKGV